MNVWVRAFLSCIGSLSSTVLYMKWLGLSALLFGFSFFGQVMAEEVQTTVLQVQKDEAAQVFKQPFTAEYFAFKKQQEQRPIIALVLGSGGARGYAHIGVIEVLEQAGIRPDLIVGTSAGSIVGSIYASGVSAERLRQIASEMKAKDVRDFTLDWKGFFNGEKVQKYVNTQTGNRLLEDMDIPMYVVATELQYGKKVVFASGDTGQAVQASISIPSMFVPAKIAGHEYVDGGLSSPVPVQVAKDLGADIVIAVDILAQPEYTETSNIWQLFNQNIYIMQQHLAAEELKNADVVIKPELKEKVHIFNVNGRDKTIQAGIDAAQDKVSQISRLIEAYQGPMQVPIQQYSAEQLPTN